MGLFTEVDLLRIVLFFSALAEFTINAAEASADVLRNFLREFIGQRY